MPKQVNENLQEVDSDKDETYKPNEIANLFIKTLKSEGIASNFSLKNIQNLGRKVKLNYQGEEIFFLAKNFTWVGNPHPENRKRIQVKLNQEEEILLYQKRLFLIGIYHFGKAEACGFYQIKEKLVRKWNNSSVMWINIEDLKTVLSREYEKKSDDLGIIHLFKDLENLLLYVLKSKKEEIVATLAQQKTVYEEGKFVILNRKEFDEKEEGIHNFLENNLSAIFPNLTFLRHKWPIPHRKKSESGEVDTLAYHHNSERKWENFVLLEYKWKSKQESPIDQVRGYYGTLIKDTGNFDELKGILEEYFREHLPWKYKEEFWNRFILICVAPFGYYESSSKIKRQVESLNQYKIKTILLEIQKYEDDVALISFLKDESRDEYMKLLGVDFHKIIVSHKRVS